MAMKITISIPEGIYHAADAMARRLGISMGELCRRAIADFVAKDEKPRGARLDGVHGDSRTRTIDPFIRAAAEQVLSEELAKPAPAGARVIPESGDAKPRDGGARRR